MLTGLTPNTFTKLQLNAGCVFKNLDYSTATDKATLAALLKTSTDKMLGATRGGGKFEAKPQTREITADGMRGPFKGSTIIDGWDIKLDTTLLEVTGDNIKLALGAADAVTAEGGKKTTITLRNEYTEEDYVDSLVWIGDLSDGGYALIDLNNALAKGGFSFTYTDKGEGTVPVSIEAHRASVDDNGTAPCKIVLFN